MFSLPNPKKTITIEFSVEQIMKGIPKITAASDSKYNVTEVNAIFNQVTLECSEFLSLGVYIDFNLAKKSETSTEVTIEIRRKIGSFDNAVELQNANHHFIDLVNYLSSVIIMSDDEFNKKYSAVLETIANKNNEDNKPWFAKKNIATLYIILGIFTLPFLIGFIILPIGLYARKKNKEYLNSNWGVLLLIMGLGLSCTANAQWTYEKIDNGFDTPYRIAYTEDNRGCYLKLEKLASNGEVMFYIGNGHTCDDEPLVDLAFLVNKEYKKYTVSGITSGDRKTLFLIPNMLSDNCLNDFRTCTSLKLRINDASCSEEVYEFNMSGSTAALKFIDNK
jgi:hypothetical protein